MRRPLFLLLCVCLLCGRGGADEVKEAARLAARQTAAVIALRNLSRSAGHVSHQELVRLIRADLASHRFSAPALARVKLEKGFEGVFSRLVKQAVGKSDPKGELERWLAERAARRQGGERESLKDAAARNCKEFLSRPYFETAYEKARGDVVAEQMRQVRQVVLEDKSRSRVHPDESWIEEAYTRGNGRAWAGKLRRDLENKVGQPFLAETDAQIEKTIADLQIAGGLRQLKAQLALLRSSPAHTEEGKRADYLQRLERHVRGARPAASVKLYGVFPVARRAAREQAARDFEAAVAASAREALARLARGQLDLPAGLEGEIRKQIQNAPVPHHLASASRKALAPLTARTVRDAKEWIIEPLLKQAREKPSDFDDREKIRKLPDAIERLESKGGLARKEWVRLSEAVGEKVKKLIDLTREKIAAEQTLAVNSALARGRWRPGEETILAVAPANLTIDRLRSIPLWKGKPPRKAEIVEEGWRKWIAQAARALERGAKAHARQLKLARELEPGLIRQVEERPGDGRRRWVEAGVRLLLKRWSREADASIYPDAFPASLRLVEAAVARALARAEEKVRERGKATLSQRVLAAQLAVVERLVPEARNGIKSKIEAGERLDPARVADNFIAEVKGGWKKSSAFATYGKDFQELLPPVKAAARGVVSELFPSTHPGGKGDKGKTDKGKDGDGKKKPEVKPVEKSRRSTPTRTGGGGPSWSWGGVSKWWRTIACVLLAVLAVGAVALFCSRSGAFEPARGKGGPFGWWREWLADMRDLLACWDGVRRLGPSWEIRLRRVQLLGELTQRLGDQVEGRMRGLLMPAAPPARKPAPAPSPVSSTAITASPVQFQTGINRAGALAAKENEEP